MTLRFVYDNCGFCTWWSELFEEMTVAELVGNTVYGENLLREAGLEEFSEYNLTPGDPAPMSAQMSGPEYSGPE